jgi:outer membrane protein assembly factor BamB
MILKFVHHAVNTALLVLALLLASNASAGDWPHWRGPNHNGTAEESNLPGVWSEQNILWKSPMPGQSSSSPIVVGERVYCVSNSQDMKTLFGLCLKHDTGEVIWQKALVENVEQPKRNTAASPSPVSDGSTVYFTFGTGDLIATDLDGNVKWSKNLVSDYGPISQQFGYSSTPLFFKGKLYVAIMRGQWDRMELDEFTDADSFILCRIRRTARKSGKPTAPAMAPTRLSTPTPAPCPTPMAM